jgi:hypothetical protein
MIVVYPFLVLLAVAVAAANRDRAGGRGWRWFVAWTVAGAVFSFSLATGLSIGLLILPLAALVLLAAAFFAPHTREGAGFIAGIGIVALLIAFVGTGDPRGWLATGIVLISAMFCTYAVARSSPGR